jgi:hypothetical protein
LSVAYRTTAFRFVRYGINRYNLIHGSRSSYLPGGQAKEKAS